MRPLSAGLLLFRRRGRVIEVFLVHPGGPLWQKKDVGAWSIPKGEYSDSEDPLAAARREFAEETGFKPAGNFIPLGSISQAGGKTVTAWAIQGDCSTTIRSNNFTMEWPPKSGQEREFPEVDRGAWFSVDEARIRINKAQVAFLERLQALIDQAKH